MIVHTSCEMVKRYYTLGDVAKTNALRVIIGNKGDIIHTEKNTCDGLICVAKMNQISKEQIR